MPLKAAKLNISNTQQVIDLIAQHQNPRGIEHWSKLSHPEGVKSFGVGLTQLRKLAKQIGRNRSLALDCWQSEYYDVKVIGLLIDDPKAIDVEQAESQVEQLNAGMLTHIFSSCDATLAKSPIAFELVTKWQDADDDLRKQSAYGLLYELSKNKRDARLSDAFFNQQIEHIDSRIDQESKGVRLAMATALMGIGKRSRELNRACVAVAERVGPIDFSQGESRCDPFDVLKHLQSPALMTKLGIES